MAGGIPCCPNFFIALPDHWLCIVETHTPDCVEIVYELPLLPNNTASETFLHHSGAVRSVDWIFIIGAPAWRGMGEYVPLDKTFYNFLFKREVVAATVTFKFSSLAHSSMRPFLEIQYFYYALIMQYNYDVH